MKKLMTVAAVSLIGLTAACGGADRPTKADLAEQFESQSSDSIPIDADAADCMAEEVHGSDMSNGTLQDIVDGEIDLTGFTVRLPEDDLEAWEAITDDVVACVAP
ncbi:hypothetical protein [Aeromicrobium alkaliterrae]|uniref:Uncharacterized protein n=1 Tax=Aeromicrobium alkaliterrae TaxID=302168 RepID=A0ABP4VIA1_9ACTN